MDIENASFWLDTIAGGAVAVWAAGAWFVQSTRHRCDEPVQEQVTVDCAPSVVAAQLTQAIANARRGSPLQQAHIESATDREVRWASGGPLRMQGAARLHGDGRRTRVELELRSGGGPLTAARLVVLFGAVATVALYLVLRQYVLPSENPGVRGQVFQMVQAVHLLWPPFLLAGIARAGRSMALAELKRVVGNAPFVAGNGPTSAGRG